MKTYPNRLWIVVLLLGWLFDFLFWKHPVGVNFALFSTLCLLGGFGLLLLDGARPAGKTIWLLVPFLFFATITFLRQEPLTVFLAYTFSIISLVLIAVSYTDGKWIEYGLSEYILKPLYLVRDMVIHPLGLMISTYKAEKESISQGKVVRRLPVAGIVRGLLIALPIIILFTSMFASADLVFDQKLSDFLDKFEAEDISEYIQRTIYILISAYLIAGVFLHAAFGSTDEKTSGERKSLLKPFLGFTEASIVLGSVTILFLIFVIIQFQYFFGGQSNIGVEGYTYSQYARRGFNELINIASISLVMIIGLSKFARRETELQKRIYSGLSIFLVVLVMVILVSAYQRIELAIDWHGYSRLRLYPRFFLIWVGVLFLTVVVLETLRLEKYFTFAFLLASFAYGATLVSVNVDDAIVRYNVPRVLEGKTLNTIHLSSLSTDAIPALVNEFKSIDIPENEHEGIGAVLVCYMHMIPLNNKALQENWQSFNYSRWLAHQAIDGVSKDLEEYTILERRYPMLVRTPATMQYECGR